MIPNNKKGGLALKGRIKYIIHLLILLAAFYLQSSPLIRRIAVVDVWPNMVFVLVFIYALYLKENEVVTEAFILGSVIDLIFGDIYGVNALLLVLFACLFYFLNRFIYSESLFSVFIYAFAATALFEGVFVLINLKSWSTGAFLPEMMERYLIKCVYNAVFTMPAYAVARRVHRKKQGVRI